MSRALAAIALLLGGCASADAPAPGVAHRDAGHAAPSAVAPPAPPGVAPAPSPKPAMAETPRPEEPEPADTLPEGFVAVPHPFDDESGESKAVLCGKLRVENLRGDPSVFEPYVVVTDTATGKKIYEAHGRRYDVGASKPAHMELTASACGDLTGDGIAELLLTERTMGAHCCYTHYVASMTSPTKLIMTWDKGDSGNGIWPVKLKPGKVWQVESVDLVWPPFDVEAGDPSVAYAGVPGFPIVFDLVGGQYQKRTFAFLGALRKEHEEGLAACAKRKDCEPYELHEWGMAVMLDEWDTKKERIIPDAELRAVLDKRSKEMKARLRAQLGG